MAENGTTDPVGLEPQKTGGRADENMRAVLDQVAASCLQGKTGKSRKPSGTTRARVSNGVGRVPEVDGRGIVARRFRDIVTAIAIDQGGLDRLAETKLQLIRRFSASCVLAEMLEAKLAAGQEIDVYALLSSASVRLAQRIGLDRVPRTVPSLSEYLADTSREDAA